MAADLAAIGIDVEVRTIEVNAFYDQLRRRQFDAALAGWASGLSGDLQPLWRSDGPDGQTVFNFVGYADPQVDRWLDEVRVATDPMQRARLFHDLQARIYADQPYTFLWWIDEVVAVHPRVHGAQIDLSSPHNALHLWSVAPE